MWGEKMSWALTVTMRKTGDLANVSATWTDPDTDLGVFTYSRTSGVTVSLADAFIAEAIAARDVWQVYQATNNTNSAWTLGRLNTADPKVT